jgi:hypothetical protein
VNNVYSIFVAKNGTYFLVAENPKMLAYFDFATGKTKDLVKMDKNIGNGLWVSRDDQFAFLSQCYDYRRDIMLAEPIR